MQHIRTVIVAIPGSATLVATNDIIIFDDTAEFLCNATDDGNADKLVYLWEINNSQWPCNVSDNTATCDVTDDCNSTISCAVENAAGTGPTGYLTTSTLGKMSCW